MIWNTKLGKVQNYDLGTAHGTDQGTVAIKSLNPDVKFSKARTIQSLPHMWGKQAKLTIGSTVPIRHSLLQATPQEDLWELFTFGTCKQLYVCEKAEAYSTLGAASQDHCSRQGRPADWDTGVCSVQILLVPREHRNHSCSSARGVEGVTSRGSSGHAADLKQTKPKWNVVSSIPSWVSSD